MDEDISSNTILYTDRKRIINLAYPGDPVETITVRESDYSPAALH